MNTKLPSERESAIQHSVITQLGAMGIELWRRNVGAMRIAPEGQGKSRFIRFAKAGQSDLWGSWNHIDDDFTMTHGKYLWGRHWEIETKATGKRPTPEQLIWLKASTARGWIAFWGDNVDTIRRVAQAVLEGGRIVWAEGDSFDVEMS